jgi:hypothetical protein
MRAGESWLDGSGRGGRPTDTVGGSRSAPAVFVPGVALTPLALNRRMGEDRDHRLGRPVKRGMSGQLLVWRKEASQ